ncbi:MAG: hypothetical protein R3A48_16010 [Polyangiales bacterium]
MSDAPLRVEVPGEPSYITSPAYGVGSFFVHVRVTRSGALDVVRVFAGDQGIEDIARGETTRKRLRAEFEALSKKLHARPIQMPADYVAARIAEVVAEHRGRGAALSERDELILASMPPLAAPPSHPTRAWPALEDAAALVEDSLRLHAEAELSRWLPSGRAVARVAEELGERPAEGETVDDRDEETRERFAAAVDAFYDDAERRRLALALRDVAVVLGATKRVTLAKTAIAVADALEDPSEARRRPRDIPSCSGCSTSTSSRTGRRRSRSRGQVASQMRAAWSSSSGPSALRARASASALARSVSSPNSLRRRGSLASRRAEQ